MLHLLPSLTLFTTLVSAAIGPKADMVVTNKNLNPDGAFNRSTVVVGVNAVGPLVQGVKGDRFQLNVIDSLTDATMLQSTSIHWHGFFQHGTNFMDGASFVNQCPIAANHSYLYDFTVPNQAGTYWYHSHLSVQYCDGLRGPFVVYDGANGVNDPNRAMYDVDDETTVITLSDWYHVKSTALLLAPAPATSNSTLINGKGRFGGNPTAPLSIVNVQAGKRYCLRVINISCDPNYMFSVDGHSLTIIEVDGVNHVPLTVNSIQIFAAQRYSVVLTANQPVANYWIRANPSFAQYTGFTGGINSAVLRYAGAPTADPTSSIQTAIIASSEVNLHPATAAAAPGSPTPGAADVVLNLTLGIGASGFTVNGLTYVNPTVPVLLQILSGAKTAQDLLPSGSVYSLPLNKVIEVNLIGGTAPGGPHPFHLHGHTFSVVKPSVASAYNFVNPVKRDTTIVAAGNTTTIRFVTDNSGPWFLHCHIEFHLEAGLAVVLAEDIAGTALSSPVPASWSSLCPTYNALGAGQL